jgi:peptidoglycan hydrolase-like protein with peptidoglycan-binding domain
MMRSRRLAIVALAAGLLAVAGAALALTGGGNDADAQLASTGTGTTEIVRQDLVETQSADGTLGYDDERTATTTRSGTVTGLPAVGSVVKTDQRLFQVDGENVYLLDGTGPAWRTLEPGLIGEDVRQLERNLRRLGHDRDHEIDVDRSWDAGTTAAVRRWQDAKGLEETGEIELGRIVFEPGDRRIAERSVTLGGPTTGGTGSTDDATAATADGSSGSTAGEAASPSAIMTTTSTRKIVSVDLETAYADLARVGATVSIELPSGDNVTGRVSSVGKVATLPEGEDVESSDATVEVTIRFRGKDRTSGLDQAPVDVEFERSRAKDVLAVPVTGLMARSGGGFAVEVRERGGRRIVPVETGLYTSGYVEIEGEGLREGIAVTNAEL